MAQRDMPRIRSPSIQDRSPPAKTAWRLFPLAASMTHPGTSILRPTTPRCAAHGRALPSGTRPRGRTAVAMTISRPGGLRSPPPTGQGSDFGRSSPNLPGYGGLLGPLKFSLVRLIRNFPANDALKAGSIAPTGEAASRSPFGSRKTTPGGIAAPRRSSACTECRIANARNRSQPPRQ